MELYPRKAQGGDFLITNAILMITCRSYLWKTILPCSGNLYRYIVCVTHIIMAESWSKIRFLRKSMGVFFLITIKLRWILTQPLIIFFVYHILWTLTDTPGTCFSAKPICFSSQNTRFWLIHGVALFNTGLKPVKKRAKCRSVLYQNLKL